MLHLLQPHATSILECRTVAAVVFVFMMAHSLVNSMHFTFKALYRRYFIQCFFFN
jgi:hypothetical protein